ncbi:MAG: adenylosuccinate synthetase, partial [Buchnera aphidicola]|nr:adenylosuccinate synthetase [Buchnera aphidicola]
LKKLLPIIETVCLLIKDTSYILYNAIKKKRTIIFEGAQGSLLDIDYGTYPYVTSSNSTVGGVITGTGIGPSYIHYTLGITKAY